MRTPDAFVSEHSNVTGRALVNRGGQAGKQIPGYEVSRGPAGSPILQYT